MIHVLRAHPVAPVLLLGLGLGLAACRSSEAKKKRTGPPRPNVILVMSDDQGWGDAGFAGHQVLQTPHLDAMAAEGLVLERFYAAAPVCSPTRASVLTGKHPARLRIPGANAGHLPSSESTLAELLRSAGYHTGHFGKWHLGTLTRDVEDGRRGGRENEHYSPPWWHGFEECFSTEQAVATWDPMDNQFLATPTRYWTGPGRTANENLAGDDSRVIVDRVLPFIERAQEKEQPFLAVVWLHAPHQPVVAGPEYLARHADLTEGQQHYFGVLEAMDEQVGRLRAFLSERGLAENTLLWFCSDNGPEGRDAQLADPTNRYQGSTGGLRGRKRSLLEGGVRVPGLVVWPGHIEPATRSRVPMVTSDILPTLAELLELDHALELASNLDGVSMAAALQGATEPREAPIGFTSGKQRAWLDESLKLFSRDEGETYALYDLDVDPGEHVDLAAEQPERVAAMRADLEAWLSSCERSGRRLLDHE